MQAPSFDKTENPYIKFQEDAWEEKNNGIVLQWFQCFCLIIYSV